MSLAEDILKSILLEKDLKDNLTSGVWVKGMEKEGYIGSMYF